VFYGTSFWVGIPIAEYLYERGIDFSCAFRFGEAIGLLPPRADPLVLDLDRDGVLETTGIPAPGTAGTTVFFDLDADGIRTAVGWVAPDDGLLVLDRNGNGLIDNGRELFGDATPLNGNGTLDLAAGIAAHGFQALDKEDTNRDGIVSAADARFANLRMWRDLNRDGVSQAGELTTLATEGIVSITVASTEVSQNLPNGNQLFRTGSFTRSDGTTSTSGAAGAFNFTVDTFQSQFTNTGRSQVRSATPLRR
jgi:hypothetical protein